VLRLTLAAAAAVFTLGTLTLSTGVRPAQAASGDARERVAFVDNTIAPDERAVLESLTGFAPPEFDGHVRWLSEERPTFESLRGKVVVIQSWSMADRVSRGALRRARALLGAFDAEDVQLITLHTPEDHEDAMRRLDNARSFPEPSAIDTRGAWSDEMGLWKEPRAIVIDRDGVIRYAGVSVIGLRDAVKQLVAERHDPITSREAEPLPPRAERDIEEPKPGARPIADGGFPPHNRGLTARDLQGQRGPSLEVGEYIIGSTPNTDGKVLMIEFWATWCGPCIAGIPHLNELQRAFEDDLVIVGISDEAAGTVRQAIRRRNLDFDYHVAVDQQRRAINTTATRGIPHCVVMSSDGVVRWQGHPGSLDEDTMRQIVNANRALNGGGERAGEKRWVTDDAGE